MWNLCNVAAVCFVLVACSAEAPRPAVVERPPEIEIVRAGERLVLSDTAARVLVARVEKALAVCNVTSEKAPKVFAGDLQEQWARTVTVEAAIHGQLMEDPARLGDESWKRELVDLMLRYLLD